MLLACVYLSHCSVVKSVAYLVLSVGFVFGPRTPASLRAIKNPWMSSLSTDPKPIRLEMSTTNALWGLRVKIARQVTSMVPDHVGLYGKYGVFRKLFLNLVRL